MKITKQTAARALAMLDADGTPEAAAYQGRVTLTAIAPYSDRALSAAVDVLEWIARHKDRAKVIAQIRRAYPRCKARLDVPKKENV